MSTYKYGFYLICIVLGILIVFFDLSHASGAEYILYSFCFILVLLVIYFYQPIESKVEITDFFTNDAYNCLINIVKNEGFLTHGMKETLFNGKPVRIAVQLPQFRWTHFGID